MNPDTSYPWNVLRLVLLPQVGDKRTWRHPSYGSPEVEVVGTFYGTGWKKFVLVQVKDGVRHLARVDRLEVC